MEDLISILVPVYNVQAWLPDCLASIAAQTYTNLEAIIVDDGSTDGSGEICDAMARADSRFRVLHLEKKGVSAARNAAIAEAKGKYVYFADADDCMHPKALELLHAAICSGPYRLATADFVEVNAHGGWKDAIGPQDFKPREVSAVDGFLSCVDRWGFSWLVVWNKLIDRSLIEGKEFDAIAQEDVLFVSRLYMDIDVFVHLDLVLYSYLKRPGGLTKDKEYMGFRSEANVKEYMYNYAAGNEMFQGLVLKKSFRKYMLYRYQAEDREARKKVNDAFRPFIKKHMKEYRRNRTIPTADKLLFPVLYRCPWIVWIFMKVAGN